MVLEYKLGYDLYKPVLTCEADYKTERVVADHFHSKKILKGNHVCIFTNMKPHSLSR